ncbi:MAG: 2OG-Fe(II) oxygenase [Burkholderiaceae bacterium]
MQFDRLPPALRDWFRDAIARGTTRAAVIEALVGAGYQRAYAEEAVVVAWNQLGPPPVAVSDIRLVDPAVVANDEAVGAGVSRAAPHATPNRVVIDGHEVELRFALKAPRVILFGQLLTEAECDEMIERSRDKLERSSVVNADTGVYDVHPHRTSLGTHFRRGENPLIRRIEQRIATLLDFPVIHGEPIQILYYRAGAEYRPHFDYFDPARPGSDKVLAMGGQRIATLIMYLNDCAAGGATVFPVLGLEVMPHRGDALYFAYTAADGTLDERSLHGGSPVVSGEKWIATKWLREFEYVGPSA